MDIKYGVGSKCVCYDSTERKLFDCVVRSIQVEQQITDDGVSITSVVYYVQCGSVHKVGLSQHYLFDSREHFISEVLK